MGAAGVRVYTPWADSSRYPQLVGAHISGGATGVVPPYRTTDPQLGTLITTITALFSASGPGSHGQSVGSSCSVLVGVEVSRLRARVLP